LYFAGAFLLSGEKEVLPSYALFRLKGFLVSGGPKPRKINRHWRVPARGPLTQKFPTRPCLPMNCLPDYPHPKTGRPDSVHAGYAKNLTNGAALCASRFCVARQVPTRRAVRKQQREAPPHTDRAVVVAHCYRWRFALALGVVAPCAGDCWQFDLHRPCAHNAGVRLTISQVQIGNCEEVRKLREHPVSGIDHGPPARIEWSNASRRVRGRNYAQYSADHSCRCHAR
jgi:hypothetical protein